MQYSIVGIPRSKTSITTVDFFLAEGERSLRLGEQYFRTEDYERGIYAALTKTAFIETLDRLLEMLGEDDMILHSPKELPSLKTRRDVQACRQQAGHTTSQFMHLQ